MYKILISIIVILLMLFIIPKIMNIFEINTSLYTQIQNLLICLIIFYLILPKNKSDYFMK